MNSFEDLGIDEKILKSINELGFKEPTEIQERCIKPIIEGNDLVGKSETGSGKTLAFGCGIIQNKSKDEISSIVLTPTRELAMQVSENLRDYSKHISLKVVPIYGGVSIENQMKELKKANIVVATPGRCLDHIQRRTIDLSKVRMIVLDEADRMVDMGFIDDVEKIMAKCPKERQTLLFSATLSPEIKKIEKKYMKEPVRMLAEDYVDPSKLKQVYYDVLPSKKFSLLVHLLKEDEEGLKLVFCNTKKEVDFITENLNFNGIESIAIHGGFTQSKRTQTMNSFKNQKVKVLVCTDVAARGLDIPGVSHVYNYDIPMDKKDYVHRIGRTARAGQKGRVVNILAPRDHENFSKVLELGINVEKKELPTLERVNMKQQQTKKPSHTPFRKENYPPKRTSKKPGRENQRRRGKPPAKRTNYRNR
ncbi:MAG: DEAD/DEAH box helicase [Candidatus Nanoarchaeia archaeon]